MRRIPATTEKAEEGWEHIPLVKLAAMLKQMVWFSGTCDLDVDKAYYEKNRLVTSRAIPRSIKIHTKHKGKEIVVVCSWQERDVYPSRFAIGIETPCHPKFRLGNPYYYRNSNLKYIHSRYYDSALDRIENAIQEAQKVIDEEIEEVEQHRKKKAELNADKDELCRSLDVKINTNEDRLIYRQDNEYCLHFKKASEDNKLYKVVRIGGSYTEAEIKKIIEIIGGNPRAIAERLLE